MPAPASTTSVRASSKRSEFAEFFETRIDFGALQRAEAFHAEPLTAEASHDRAVDHRPAQLASADVIGLQVESLLSQVPDKASGEAIAGAGRVEHRLQQVARHDEEGILVEQHGSILTALDHQGVRPHIKDGAGSLLQIVLAAEHAGFGV